MGVRESRERRVNPRVPVDAAVMILRNGARSGPYPLENLSAGGALIQVPDSREEHWAEGAQLKLLLQVPERKAMTLLAEVAHRGLSTGGVDLVGIIFRDVPTDVEDVLQELVLASLEKVRRVHAPTVLVVDDSKGVCHALKRDLRALGEQAALAVTPLEAVNQLQDPHAEFHTVLVDKYLGHSDGVDILEFLATEYPDIRRVLMSGLVDRKGLEPAISAGRAHAVLEKPWNRDSLANVLGE